MEYLKYIQLGIAVLLVVAILLQNRGGGMSGLFGGSDGNVYMTKRGFDKKIFYATIVLAVLFFSVSLISVIL